jgi:hypothetical protein
METQTSIFDAPSRSALPLLRSTARRRTLSDLVAEAIAAAGGRGLTDEEFTAAVLERDGAHKESSCRARRVELVAVGDVVDSGRTRLTRSSVAAKVWLHRSHVDAGNASDSQAVSRETQTRITTPAASPQRHDVTSAARSTPALVGVQPASVPCLRCNSREWLYPPADAPEPRSVTCARCGRWVGRAPPAAAR